MVPFAGWNMPVMYSSIMREHAAVRERAGIFDISHMGQFVVRGEAAASWLDRMLTNRVAALEVGQGQYSFLLNERGSYPYCPILIFQVFLSSFSFFFR